MTTRALVLLLIALLAGTPPAAATESRQRSRETAVSKPNVLLITTDDMRESDLRWMPATRRLIGRRGVRVRGFLSTHPLCCPARAEILTGQYGHNNGVHHNSGEFGGYRVLSDKGNHLGSWLQAAGYTTVLVGKHLNRWTLRRQHQAGWTIFNPIERDVYAAFGLTMFNDGAPRHYPGVHTGDLIGRLTARYIRRLAPAEAPFFIWASQVPPHGTHTTRGWVPPIPARRHRALYPHARSPSVRDPAFNEADVSDKPRWVRNTAKVPVTQITAVHRARIRALRSVDEQVQAAVDALRASGELNDTVIIFTSDNGISMGEHRLLEKNHPYQPAMRIPLLVRGPGLPPGTSREALFGLVDLAPTITDLAQVAPGRELDGVSMVPTLTEGAPGYRHHLIQAGAIDHPWWWRGVRSRRYLYARYRNGVEELYDLRRDPSQLRNIASVARFAAVRERHEAWRARLIHCQGPECWSSGGPPR